MNRETILNMVYTSQADAVANAYAALAAENERLRKAGDEVALHYAERIEIEAGETVKTLMRTLPVLKAWNAAKEGRDAK